MLIWYWQILWKATVPSLYFQGFLSPPFFTFFRNSLQGAFPPTMGLLCNVPTSTAMCASCWVGDDLGDLPASSNFSASSLLLYSSSCEGGTPAWGPFPQPPLVLPLFLPFWKLKSNQSEIVAVFLRLHAIF